MQFENAVKISPQICQLCAGRIKWGMRTTALLIEIICLFTKLPWPGDSEGFPGQFLWILGVKLPLSTTHDGGLTLSFLMLNV